MLPTRRLKVFLCRSSSDKPVVRELYQKLSSEGWIDAWLDEEKLLPGQNWHYEIETELDRSDAVIVTLSTESVAKEGYVQRELNAVLDIALEKPEGSIFVIPLRLDDCVIPRRLRVWQWLNYYPEDQKQIAYQRLLESLKLRAETFGISTHDPAVFRSAPVGIPKDRQAEEKKADSAPYGTIDTNSAAHDSGCNNNGMDYYQHTRPHGTIDLSSAYTGQWLKHHRQRRHDSPRSSCWRVHNGRFRRRHCECFGCMFRLRFQ